MKCSSCKKKICFGEWLGHFGVCAVCDKAQCELGWIRIKREKRLNDLVFDVKVKARIEELKKEQRGNK